MIQIPLTRGYVTVVDDEDRELAALRWRAMISTDGRRVYAVWSRRERVNGKPKIVSRYLHRMVAERMGLAIDGRHVDHRFGDTLNNRRGNLRAVAPRVNIRNQPSGNSRNTSGELGVHWHVRNQRWHATIRNGAGKIHLGAFHTKEEAAAARLAGERELWGIQPRRAEAHAPAAA